MKVGPISAGARPGPACYGLGGTEPTVSDADLILGYLNPDTKIAGKKLSKEKAVEAVEKLGKKIGKNAEEMAIGIFDLVNENMGGIVRSELISRGLDYTQFALLCYGGAGPLHMTEIVRMVGMKRCIVPANASAFSAYGLCFVDIKVRDSKEVVYPEPWDARTINGDFTQIEKELLSKVKATGVSEEDISVRRVFAMQFKGQFYQLRVPVPVKELTQEDLAKVKEEFVNTYTSRYGKASLIPGAMVIIMSEESECVGKTLKAKLPLEKETAQIPAEAVMLPRKVYDKKVGGFVEAEVYNGDKLLAGNRIEGPALIDFPHTSIRLGQGEVGVLDQHRDFIVWQGG